MFRFKKLVTEAEAKKKGWEISYRLPSNQLPDDSKKKDEKQDDSLKVIVEREELVPGYRAIELHPVAVDFVTAGGVDISSIFECAYEPLNPVLMKKSSKNWLDFAETQIINIIGAWGRKQEDDARVLKSSINEIMSELANDIFGVTNNSTSVSTISVKETVLNYLNEEFEKLGFKIANITIYMIVNGPQSQDVKNSREAIKKAELELTKAETERKTAFEKGMATIDLNKEQLKNEAAYIQSVTDTNEKTTLAVARELGNGSINTLVLGEGFSTEAFTGSKVAGQQKGAANV
jgi:hypothetical protein